LNSLRLDPAIGRRVRADRALVRQIGVLAGGAGTLVHHSQTAWSSPTFAGTRHRMAWTFARENEIAHGHAMAACLPSHDFDLPGHLVVSSSVTSSERRMDPPHMLVELELMLLEEA
jgi:hypothetical protein